MIQLFEIKVTTGSPLEVINKSINQSGYTCLLNSHMIYEHKKNPAFVGVLENASYILPDGMPIINGLKLIKRFKQDRIPGYDCLQILVEIAKVKGLKIFVIGGESKVLNKISLKFIELSINHKVYSPPFRPVDVFDFQGQEKMINQFDPDIILVGLGCPKQEIWMKKMKEKVRGHMYGLGGALLLYSGHQKRAPKWMRNMSLEWLFRLWQEPKRLFWRYLVTNLFFSLLFMKELLIKKKP